MRLSMDITASAQIDSMAASANNGVQLAMLKKALDQSGNSTMQLLQSLPQKDGAGKIVDVQA